MILHLYHLSLSFNHLKYTYPPFSSSTIFLFLPLSFIFLSSCRASNTLEYYCSFTIESANFLYYFLFSEALTYTYCWYFYYWCFKSIYYFLIWLCYYCAELPAFYPTFSFLSVNRAFGYSWFLSYLIYSTLSTKNTWSFSLDLV